MQPGDQSLQYNSLVSASVRKSNRAAPPSSSNKAPQVYPSTKANSIAEWSSLPFPVKLFSGTLHVGVTVAIQFVTGYVSGYVLGTLTGIPLLFRPLDPSTVTSSSSSVFLPRLVRWHSRSARWGGTCGPLSAVFSGFDETVKLVRNFKEDQWNSVLSSAAAGAYFRRQSSPRDMVQGALLYGGITYLLTRQTDKLMDGVEEKVE